MLITAHRIKKVLIDLQIPLIESSQLKIEAYFFIK